MYNNNVSNYRYNNGNGMMKVPKPTKSNVENYICMCIGVHIDCVTLASLSERPRSWKHSCLNTGVTVLAERTVNFYGVATIYFATCPNCNKIIYYVEE